MTLLTEKEAAEKWCPMARAVENAGTMPASFNRVQETKGATVRMPPGSVCIGSNCMAWRWTRAGMVFDVTEDRGAIFRQQKVDDPAYGYCGAFGKIEP